MRQEEVEAVGGQRKKKGGRVTPKGCAPSQKLTQEGRAELEELFATLLRSAPEALRDDLPPVVVEMWASQMWSTWANADLIGMDATEVVAGGLIAYAGTQGPQAALTVLRAIGAVAPEPYGQRARRAADRLAAEGVPEKTWAALVGAAAPTVAGLMYDPYDDDGVNVMVGFDTAGTPSTVSLYIDHNLGGMAKDAFAAPAAMAEVLTVLQNHADEDDGHGHGGGQPVYREITLAEAAARWRDALAATDRYLDPPSNEELDHLRALVTARLATLPPGGGVPAPAEMDEDERDVVLSAFLESDEAVGLFGIDADDDETETVEQLSHQILTFSLDYVVGTPLRFSPVMVEMFCLDWAPRKIAMDGDAFTVLPDVLAAWIRFVGRRRAVPASLITEAVKAVYGYAPEMIELSQDPEVWGPAKTMVLAIEQRGIDLTDQGALDDFIDEVNRDGGIDVLAESLAGSVAPKR